MSPHLTTVLSVPTLLVFGLLELRKITFSFTHSCFTPLLRVFLQVLSSRKQLPLDELELGLAFKIQAPNCISLVLKQKWLCFPIIFLVFFLLLSSYWSEDGRMCQNLQERSALCTEEVSCVLGKSENLGNFPILQ